MRYKAKSTMVGWYREPTPLLEKIQQGLFYVATMDTVYSGLASVEQGGKR